MLTRLLAVVVANLRLFRLPGLCSILLLRWLFFEVLVFTVLRRHRLILFAGASQILHARLLIDYHRIFCRYPRTNITIVLLLILFGLLISFRLVNHSCPEVVMMDSFHSFLAKKHPLHWDKFISYPTKSLWRLKICLRIFTVAKNFSCYRNGRMLHKEGEKKRKNHIYHVSLGFSFLSAAFFHTGSNWNGKGSIFPPGLFLANHEAATFQMTICNGKS